MVFNGERARGEEQNPKTLNLGNQWVPLRLNVFLNIRILVVNVWVKMLPLDEPEVEDVGVTFKSKRCLSTGKI